jgi:polar amino acid transport system substrate-binding protein
MSHNGDGGFHGGGRPGGHLQAAVSIARRDLLEFIRDRRTLFITLLLPMVTYPIVALASALGLRTAMVDIEARQMPSPLAVVVSGAEARQFTARVDELRRSLSIPEGDVRSGWPSSIDWRMGRADTAATALDGGQGDVWIDVPRGFLESLDRDGTVKVEAHLPRVRPVSRRSREQFTAVIRSLGDDARRRRIAKAGLPPSVLEPIRLTFPGDTVQAVVPIDGLVPRVAGAILVLLAVLTMTGAFYPAIDAIAGEKERGTIETLLIAPCGPRDIVFGKFMAVYAVTLATLAANIVSISLTATVTFRLLPTGVAAPLRDVGTVIGVTVVAFAALAALAAATCLAVTTASKSTKEAQNTLTPVILLVSALAGAALIPGMDRPGLIAAVPFAGHVIVAKEAVAVGNEPPRQAVGSAAVSPRGKWRLAVPLATTLLSSAVVTWLMLRGTAAMLTDEELLFRGPDVAGGVLSRPARRRRPGIAQGGAAILGGLAAIWYGQALGPADLRLAIPLQQAAVLLPMAALLWWQRVDLRSTFFLRWPVAGDARHRWFRAAACLAGAAVAGAGLFVIGAVAILAVRGTNLTAESQQLSARLVALIRGQPWWLSWCLIALLPAVCEELFFRGWVQSAFTGRAGSRGRVIAAVVTQAAFFAVFHLLPERMPQTFVLGLMLGWITAATGSLWPAMACHAAHNTMPLVLAAAIGTASTPTRGLPGWAVPAALAAVAIGLLVIVLAVRSVRFSRRRGAASAGTLPAIWLAAGVATAAVAIPGRAAAADAPAPEARRLRVAVAERPVVLDWRGGQPVGVMIDIWKELAEQLGVENDLALESGFDELLTAVRSGKADVAIPFMAITEERERTIDFTHPLYSSGLRIAVRQREESGFLPAVQSLLSWRLAVLLGGILALAVASGHLLWWLERGHNPSSFPQRYPRGVVEAIWWIASTIVTGGCDDKHVDSVAGRAIAFLWMVGGIVLLAAFTSVLTATMTAERVAGTIHGPRDLAGRTVGCQRANVSIRSSQEYGAIVQEFLTTREALDALALGMVDAVVEENQSLQFLLNDPNRRGIRIVGRMFDAFDYGLALPSGSPLREELNTAILRMREDGTLDRIKEKWLGRHD